MLKYWETAKMSMRAKTNGGVYYLFPQIIVQAANLVPLLFLWRVALSSGAASEMSLSQMLTYTYVSSLLSEMMVVRTAASGWLSEGLLLRLYNRPMSVLGQLIAQTIGGWLPMLLLFSLPMALLAPLFGVGILPESPLFFLSLLLCVSLGFAIDFLFACLSIKLNNKSWLVNRVRMAVVSVLSGTVIPMRLLPFGIGEMLQYQPFASLGGAPLSIFVGAAEPVSVVGVQCFWNIFLWAAALLAFNKSQERMVSYGG